MRGGGIGTWELLLLRCSCPLFFSFFVKAGSEGCTRSGSSDICISVCTRGLLNRRFQRIFDTSDAVSSFLYLKQLCAFKLLTPCLTRATTPVLSSAVRAHTHVCYTNANSAEGGKNCERSEGEMLYRRSNKQCHHDETMTICVSTVGLCRTFVFLDALFLFLLIGVLCGEAITTTTKSGSAMSTVCLC
jgi:hypothetical protein